MFVDVDGDTIELDEEQGVFIRTICAATNRTPLELVIKLLTEYQKEVEKEFAQPNIN